MFHRFCVTLLALCVLTTTASAFDGHRRGFVLGGGLGLGVASFTQELSSTFGSVESDRETRGGLASDFFIGFGLSETATIYWSYRASWFNIENAFERDVTITTAVEGIGITTYHKPYAPSTYFTAAIGFSNWTAPFEDDTSNAVGLGLRAGFGYEFRPHWSIELGATVGNPSETEDGVEFTTNVIAIQAVLVGTAY